MFVCQRSDESLTNRKERPPKTLPIVTGLSNAVAVLTVHSLLLMGLTEVDTASFSNHRLSAYYIVSTQYQHRMSNCHTPSPPLLKREILVLWFSASNEI